jgi:hypothetical protein
LLVPYWLALLNQSEALLLDWFATDRGFVSSDLPNQARDPIQDLLVGDAQCHPPVVRDLVV